MSVTFQDDDATGSRNYFITGTTATSLNRHAELLPPEKKLYQHDYPK